MARRIDSHSSLRCSALASRPAPSKSHSPTHNTDDIRESFNDIYLDLSKEPGKCRIAESGLGWRPHNGETWTLDKAEITNAQWSRAARGYELKIYARKEGVVQLDGFKQDVRSQKFQGYGGVLTLIAGVRDTTEMLQSLVRHRTGSKRACTSRLELGEGRDGA